MTLGPLSLSRPRKESWTHLFLRTFQLCSSWCLRLTHFPLPLSISSWPRRVLWFPGATNYHKLNGLKQQKFLLSWFWELESKKSKCWQDHALSEGCKGRALFASSSFWWLPAILGIRGSTNPGSASISVWHSLPCVRVQASLFLEVIELGPTLIWYNPILTRLHLQRPYFQIRSHLQILGN